MTKSQKVIERDIKSHLDRKNSVGGQNPLSSLCDAIGQDGVQGKARVEMALKSLQRQGVVTVNSSQGLIGTISLTPQPDLVTKFGRAPRHDDRTDRSPEQKRQAIYAKGVPAYLPDDKVGPL